MTGQNRGIIRNLYSTIDESLDSYLTADKLKITEQATEAELAYAKKNLIQTIDKTRKELAEFLMLGAKTTDNTGVTKEVKVNKDANYLSEIRKKLQQDDDNDSLYNDLGNYYFQRERDYRKAIEQYLMAISKNQENYVYYANIGDAYLQLEEYDESTSWYKQALDKKPEDDLILNSIGVAYYRKGEFDQAAKYYSSALKINPQPVYLVNIGDTYARKKLYDDAAKAYENAILLDKDKNYSPAYDALGDVYRLKYALERDDRSLLEKAIDNYQKSLLIDPKNSRNHSFLGDLFYYQGNYDQAIESYKQATLLDEDDSDSYANIGYMYFWKEDYDKANQFYNIALDKNENNVKVLKYIGDLNSKFKKYDQAIEFYQKYLAKYPDDHETLSSLGEMYVNRGDESKGDNSKALEIAKKISDSKPDDWISLSNLAYAYKLVGDTENVVKNLTKAIELNNTVSYLYTDLGEAYYTKFFYDEAKKQFEKAVELDDSDPVNYSWLTVIYSILKDWPQALRYAKLADKKAKEQDPKNDTYIEYISGVYHSKGLDLYKSGKLDEAIVEYISANNIKESQVTYFNLYLCYFYSDPQRTKEAREAISKAIQLNLSQSKIPKINPEYEEALKRLK